MAIVKMKLMNIIADKKYLEEVLLRFHKLDNFHPELATKIVDRVHGLTTLQDENPYTEIMNRFQDIYMDMGMILTSSNVKNRDCDLQKIKDYI